MSGSNVAHSNVNSLGKAIMWTGIGGLGATTAILTTAIKTQAVWLSFALTSSVFGFPLLALLASATFVVAGAMVVLCDENKQSKGTDVVPSDKNKPTVATITNLSPSEKTAETQKLEHFKKNLENNLKEVAKLEEIANQRREAAQTGVERAVNEKQEEAAQNAVKETPTVAQSTYEIKKDVQDELVNAQEKRKKSLEPAGFFLSQIDQNEETIAQTIGWLDSDWQKLKNLEKQLNNKVVKIPGEDGQVDLDNTEGAFLGFQDKARQYCHRRIKYTESDFSRFVEKEINSRWNEMTTVFSKNERTQYCLQLQYLIVVLRCLIAHPESLLLEKLYQAPVAPAPVKRGWAIWV